MSERFFSEVANNFEAIINYYPPYGKTMPFQFTLLRGTLLVYKPNMDGKCSRKDYDHTDTRRFFKAWSRVSKRVVWENCRLNSEWLVLVCLEKDLKRDGREF